MFRNILVVVDGSPHAEHALAEAIDIATSSRARLTILTSIPRPPAWVNTPATAAACAPLATELERESNEILRNAVDRVPASVPLTKILTHEPIRAALMHRIQTANDDLLVMGSRGRGALSASLLGSVSHYALNHSPIPVLVVHAPEIEAKDAAVRLEAAATRPEAAAVKDVVAVT